MEKAVYDIFSLFTFSVDIYLRIVYMCVMNFSLQLSIIMETAQLVAITLRTSSKLV